MQRLEGDMQFIVTSCAFPFRNVMLCVQYRSTSPRLQDPDVPMSVSVLLNLLVVVDVRTKKLAMSLGA